MPSSLPLRAEVTQNSWPAIECLVHFGDSPPTGRRGGPGYRGLRVLCSGLGGVTCSHWDWRSGGHAACLASVWGDPRPWQANAVESGLTFSLPLLPKGDRGPGPSGVLGLGAADAGGK